MTHCVIYILLLDLGIWQIYGAVHYGSKHAISARLKLNLANKISLKSYTTASNTRAYGVPTLVASVRNARKQAARRKGVS